MKGNNKDMAATVISGKDLAKKVKDNLKNDVEALKAKGIETCLVVIIVGDDPASRVYVNNKKKACEEVGIKSIEYALGADTSEQELLTLIDKLNKDNSVNGILVQLPLPKQISEDKVIMAINPQKDVDAFHPINVGKIMTGNPDFMPCTPAGVIKLIEETGIDIAGKECVVVGRSNIVGKPQAMLLLAKNGTVTICHSRTKDLEDVIRRADILVAAVGRPEMIKGSAIKPGAVVIDVGTNRTESKKLVGDVEFSSACEVASYITPVPGGVGPMTIAMLMENTVKAAKIQAGL